MFDGCSKINRALPKLKEKSMVRRKKLTAMGSALAVSMIASSAVSAAENPFAMQSLESGYQVAADEAKDKKAEGKCGEGKCGEGKCGEGKCGASATSDKKADGKCGEGKCGASATSDKKADGKCGEGKCGGSK
jgi:uncharacterized low-complexity protein